MKYVNKLLNLSLLTVICISLTSCALLNNIISSTETTIKTGEVKTLMEQSGYTATATVFSETSDDGEIGIVTGQKADKQVSINDIYVITFYDSGTNASIAYANIKDTNGYTSCKLFYNCVFVGPDSAWEIILNYFADKK